MGDDDLELEGLDSEDGDLDEIERRDQAGRRSFFLRGLLILLFASLFVFIGSRIVFAFLENPNRQIVTAGLRDALVITGQIQGVAESFAIAILVALGGLLLFNELDRRLVVQGEGNFDDGADSANQ